MSPLRQLPRTKPVELITDESAHTPLCRSMGLLPLVSLSVGATLGTGIFVVLGHAAPVAGPAVTVAFAVAALAALLAALSYAEPAGAVPVSGSAYSCAPATWPAFGVWSAAGLVVYFGYGRRRSELARHSAQGE